MHIYVWPLSKRLVASRKNVAFKVTRMRESNLEGRDEFMIIRESNSEEVGLEDDNQAVLDDLGYNADLYIAN